MKSTRFPALLLRLSATTALLSGGCVEVGHPIEVGCFVEDDNPNCFDTGVSASSSQASGTTGAGGAGGAGGGGASADAGGGAGGDGAGGDGGSAGSGGAGGVGL
ncbi:hypothetical protein WMF27_07155 [Sorangium sp. So ce281]|uniref:hypothetical protein n=1 Tax=unclassified Sorangium TaxID=2621164 RepID=UPI003F63D70F